MRKMLGKGITLFLKLMGRRRFHMSTYEELILILNTALLIVAILTYTNKKK